jgi:hypothetical protein
MSTRICSTCNYSTKNKYSYNKHLATKKHISLSSNDAITIPQKNNNKLSKLEKMQIGLKEAIAEREELQKIKKLQTELKEKERSKLSEADKLRKELEDMEKERDDLLVDNKDLFKDFCVVGKMLLQFITILDTDKEQHKIYKWLIGRCEEEESIRNEP